MESEGGSRITADRSLWPTLFVNLVEASSQNHVCIPCVARV